MCYMYIIYNSHNLLCGFVLYIVYLYTIKMSIFREIWIELVDKNKILKILKKY